MLRAVPFIVGPTASGKTEVSIAVANLLESKLNLACEIVSADSRQIYKHIPIATAQPDPEMLSTRKHHFVQELELYQEFSAGEFSKRARKIIEKLLSEGTIPIVCGGSGLYIHALAYGFFEADIPAEGLKEMRSHLYKELEKYGIEKLYAELEKVDPESASKMTVQSPRRIIRALEIYYLTGTPISQLYEERDKPNFKPVIFGITWERKKLYERINTRVDKMISAGLIEEVKRLKEKGYHWRKQNSLNTVGIKEVFEYLEGGITYERMLDLIKRNSRRFAKRQMTWFRREKGVKWIDADEETFPGSAAARVFTQGGFLEIRLSLEAQ